MRGLTGWILLALCGSANAAELRDVRVWAGPDSTRVVFDLDSLAQHKLFTLSNPQRIVIDLPDTLRAAQLPLQLDGKGLVRQVRSGPHDGHTLRVVLDVADGVRPKSFALQPNDNYGFRIVVDLAAAPAANAPPPPPPVALQEKPIVIAIDAGHGGEDPGTRSRSGVMEKDVALAVARKLAQRINQESGMHAILTRDGDYYVRLEDRVEKARQAQADLFVSIHCNSYKDRNVRGTAVYVLSPKGASSAQARELAEQENLADIIGGVEARDHDETLNAVLVDIRQSSAMEASYDVGGRLLNSIGRVNPLQKPQIQKAAFVVLKGVDVPSVLVETAFLSNEHDARLLVTGDYQDLLVRSMLDGIRGYFSKYRPLQQQQQVSLPVTVSSSSSSSSSSGRLQPVSLPGAAVAR
jgi:N-acetylmuramoyl-L-alanine amidase